MRLRHTVMINRYPVQAAKRAAWLRVHIRNNRGLFHKIVHKLYSSDLDQKRKVGKTTWFGRFLSKNLKIKLILEQYGGIKRINCAYCGKEGNLSKKSKFQEEFFECVECGAYMCRQCQIELKEICFICRTPLFAVSLEVDLESYSSDDDFNQINNRYMNFAKYENKDTKIDVDYLEALENLNTESEYL